MRVALFCLLIACTACHSAPEIRVQQLVTPDYPDNAHFLNIQGTVTVHIRIGPDGRVQTASGEGAHPYLVKAAEDNVRKWVFGPFPPRGEYPIYHTIKYVYILEGKSASVFYFPPAVRTYLPDRLEIQTMPFSDDLVVPAPKAR